MRGVVVFFVAVFMLAPYYLLMSMMFEPLVSIITGYSLASSLNPDSTIDMIESIMYVWGPFVYVAGWLLWAVRYYLSRNLYVGQPS